MKITEQFIEKFNVELRGNGLAFVYDELVFIFIPIEKDFATPVFQFFNQDFFTIRAIESSDIFENGYCFNIAKPTIFDLHINKELKNHYNVEVVAEWKYSRRYFLIDLTYENQKAKK